MTRIAICLAIVSLSTSQPARGGEYLFGDPVNLGFPISSSQSEVAHVSRDGLSLYVSRGRYDGPAELHVAHRASPNDSWGPLDVMDGEINDGGSVGIASTTADKLSMFFSGKISYWSGGVRQGGLGRGDIWLAERQSTDSPFGDPANVGAPINTEYLEADPSVSADGLIMVFASNRPNGFGTIDLWESRRASIDAPWQEPQNLGPLVNNSVDHETPTLSADGLTLMYSVAPNGQWSDLWVTTRNDVESPWNSPVNLGGKINTSQYVEFNPQLSTDGSTLYYSQWTNSQEFDIFEVPILPFERASLQVGLDTYEENFDDALGGNGSSIGTVLPTGWAQSENGVVLENTATQTFPVGASVRPGVYNAGAEGSLDRTLASNLQTIQLLGDVTGADASSFRLKFDVEAWDARDGVEIGGRIVGGPDNPGEAAFKVSVEVDSGDGFAPLADFGTVTTGPTLQPVFGGIVNGNSDANRISFDSGIVGAMIPSGSTLRVRWSPDTERQTAGWLFGINNVSLGLLESVDSAGDFNKDGVLTAADVDLLTAEIVRATHDPMLDLSAAVLSTTRSESVVI